VVALSLFPLATQVFAPPPALISKPLSNMKPLHFSLSTLSLPDLSTIPAAASNAALQGKFNFVSSPAIFLVPILLGISVPTVMFWFISWYANPTDEDADEEAS